MSYVYMKVLESAPERYDRGMRILTLGRLEQAKRDVAALIEPGQRVLDTITDVRRYLLGTLCTFIAQTGRRVFGQPGPDAPVFVTGNFDLTVRRVTKVLKEDGVDCYLLVAPTNSFLGRVDEIHPYLFVEVYL